MTKLSVNINKIATLRNARGGNVPNLPDFTRNIEKFGAQGITVHPRPDERHIRYSDVRELKPIITTEFNIEGNPVTKFIDLVLEVKPEQVTLVPDAEDAITSNAGWNAKKHKDFLKEVIAEFNNNGIRTSIFLDPDLAMVDHALDTGSNRIELYTEDYAKAYEKGDMEAVKIYAQCAQAATDAGMGVNAGHDLSLDNIRYFREQVPGLLEVSIGHALITESLYLGLETTIQKYLKLLQ
ncbi:pyridoxine 5'-phosphate synthase [Antarcticibacterium flavum]|uniref:Pyridoxine 5'-phosphate synthase n=1 Tax=Antarcticibacterium flavum TaxID=2058175 RepID=A0A5B7X622_9FLAO|nr:MULTISPECIES: pyridoxine 5'-phosphate synthase [Antarcticibacterium]MCM4158390.1 pyridoxine 5'-phosphate synthase [Antarcticibacterium sp. W02-3]QCY70151.1 pyridoxine 5'-phosphate synthase [Antarcticibacterium flavum]